MAVDTAVSALGADLKNDPFGIASARQKSTEQATKYEAASTEEERLRKAQAEETKPYLTSAKGLLEQQKAMKTPELGALPEYKPTKIDPEQAKEAFQTMMAFSMIGGALTKQPMLAAMNNMTAALKGNMEGDKQRVDKEIKDFERNYKLAEGKRKTQLEDYNLAFSKNKNDLQAQMSEIELVAKKYGDEIATQLAKKGDAKGLMTHFDTLARSGQQAKATADRMSLLYSKEAGKKEEKEEQKKGIEEAALAIANYSQSPPSLRDKDRYTIMRKVHEINPEYRETDYKTKDIAFRNWTNPNGAGFKQITAFGTLTSHLDTLSKLADAMGNDDLPAVNSLVNSVRTATGDPSVTNFDTAKNAVGTEFVKAIAGTAATGREREEAQQLFGAAKSPAQLKGAIGVAQSLVGGRLQVIEEQYETGTGRKDFANLLPRNARALFSGYVNEPQSAVSATVDKTDLRAKAKARIDAGADANAVKAKYKELTGEDY